MIVGESKWLFIRPTMKRRLVGSVVSIFTALAPIHGWAASDGRMVMEFAFELAEARLDLAEHMLRSSADFLVSVGDIDPQLGHVGLQKIFNDNRDFRAILALDENGRLMFDSFNPVPFRGGADLSQRQYFRDTTHREAMQLFVFPSVVGKQSGQRLIPVTMAVPGLGRGNQRVVMISVPPEAMLPKSQLCPVCGVVITSDGQVVASSHPMSEVNEIALSRLTFSGEYGASQIEVRDMPVLVHWRKSTRAKLVYIYYEAVTSETE